MPPSCRVLKRWIYREVRAAERQATKYPICAEPERRLIHDLDGKWKHEDPVSKTKTHSKGPEICRVALKIYGSGSFI